MDLTLFLTHQCNLACTYCYGGPKFNRTMDDSMIQKGVDFAFSSGDVQISFFGGEPFLELKKVRLAVDYANRLSRQKQIPVRYLVTTNGTIWNDEVASLFKENLFHLAISIDGTQESHDCTRPFKNGESSYKTIWKNLQQALSILPNLETISVIDPDNVTWLTQNFLTLLETGVTQINFSLNYCADWNDESLKQLEQGLNELSDEYVNQYRKGIPFSLDLIDHKIITHLKGGYAACDKCRFGDGELCLTPKGNFYPCERVVGDDNRPHLMIGHIDTGIDLSKVMKMASAKNELEDECLECRYNHRCMHWCGCVNFETTGTVGQTSAAVCRTEQMTIAAADRAAEQLFSEKNPLFLNNFYA